MKRHWTTRLSITAATIAIFVYPQTMRADRLAMKDGSQIEGIIQRVEGGQVTVQIRDEIKLFKLLDIEMMDFDTPHLPAGTPRLPLEHFMKDTEAQDIVAHMRDVENSAAEIHALLDQNIKSWGNVRTIKSNRVQEWEATKEEFGKALSRYQENLNDLYFHVLARVDQYNLMAKDANDLRVGVQGAFKVGSSLVPYDMKELPLKKFVPSNWYKTIFYNGYNEGYEVGFYEARPTQ